MESGRYEPLGWCRKDPCSAGKQIRSSNSEIQSKHEFPSANDQNCRPESGHQPRISGISTVFRIADFRLRNSFGLRISGFGFAPFIPGGFIPGGLGVALGSHVGAYPLASRWLVGGFEVALPSLDVGCCRVRPQELISRHGHVPHRLPNRECRRPFQGRHHPKAARGQGQRLHLGAREHTGQAGHPAGEEGP